MIPKVIHYCWFGGNKKTKIIKKCIKSWKKYCTDYQIIEWNESNFDVNCNAYCKAMYEQKKWAFLTDYVRLKIVYEYGGIYLDTDVKLIKPLDPLLAYSAYMGFEDDEYVATGLGFGAEKGHPFIKENKEYYDGLFDFQEIRTCPVITTELLGLVGKSKQDEITIVKGVTLLPRDFLCPMHFGTVQPNITSNTYSIHLFNASWYACDEKRLYTKKIKIKRKKAAKEKLRYLPNRIMLKIIGKDKYYTIKAKIMKKNNIKKS